MNYTLTPAQKRAVEDNLAKLDPDEESWPTGEQVEAIAEAILSNMEGA